MGVLDLPADAPARPPKPYLPPFRELPDTPALQELKRRQQFVVWNYQWKQGKWTKPPATVRGEGNRWADPAQWGTYEEAAEVARRSPGYGVGYVLGRDDNLTGADLDDCRDPVTGALEPWAADILSLAETYAEISPSGKGVRLFWRGKVEQATSCKPAGVEIYCGGRYLTITGNHVPGTPTEIRPAPQTERILLARAAEFLAKQKAEQEAEAARKRANGSGAEPFSNAPASRKSNSLGFPGDPFFPTVNAIAMERLDDWVPPLFPTARKQPGTGAYRVSSESLGRDLEEDLSIAPQGIKDFGVADMGDLREGKRTPIDVVLEWGAPATVPEAALWLCERFGIAPGAIGWRNGASDGGAARAEAAGGARRNAVGPDEALDEADGRPIVRIAAGELPRMTDEAEAVLIAAGTPIFAREGFLVRPVTEEAPAARGRTTMVAKLRPYCPDSLTDVFSQTAAFQKFDGRKRAWVAADPPKQVCGILLARQGSWRVPPIAGVITTPTLRLDGSVLSEPGYDPATRLYHAADPNLRLPPVDERPSHEAAEAALALLLDLLVEFPFVDPVDRAVALSCLLTPIVRGGLPTAPMHVVRAHTAGTGKSHLVDIASTIATGQPCPVIPPGKTGEELEKRLGSMILEGVPIASLDNVVGELGGEMLCQVTERALVRVRILGLSKSPTVECKTSVFATGNNIKLVGDMTRRAVLCSLDADEERPELRRFRFDPIARVLENRGTYVAAVLTLARAYLAAGAPEVCPPIGSYENWSRTVRAPLIWLGEADPVATMEVARDEDPELSAIRELFAYWRDAPLVHPHA